MGDIFKIGINDSVVANLVRSRKVWATLGEFLTSNSSSKCENCHYTPVCDLAKTGVYILVLAVAYKAVDD